MVLEQLIVEGTFDQVDPNTPDVHEELAMNHASSMVQWLLMCIENLESQVGQLERRGKYVNGPINLFSTNSCVTPVCHSMNFVLMCGPAMCQNHDSIASLERLILTTTRL